MLIFAICAAASAVYFGVTLDASIRFAEEQGRTLLVRVVETILLMIPAIASGAVQYWKLKQGGATGSRLWLLVTGTAIGAPIVGIVLMLIVVFALYGKTP